MASCGSSVATATLFRTTTTVVPTVVVSTIRTPVTLTLGVAGAVAGGSPDTDDDDSYTTTSVSTSTAISTITSSYATVLTIPTATLYSTGECAVASTSTTAAAAASTAVATSSRRVTATSTSASTVQSTSTVTSALATVSDGSGSTSIVFITYTQTMSSLEPVVVTVVEGPAASETAVTQTTTSQDHTSTGAIVGGAVGGVAGLLLLALLVWFGLRRRRRYKDQQGLDDLFQRSNGHIGRRNDSGRGLTRDDSQYSKGAEAGQISSGDQSVEEDMAEAGQQPHSSLALPALAHQPQHSMDATSGMPSTAPPSYGGQTFPPAWPLNIDTHAASQSYHTNGQPYSPPANSTPGNHAHNPYAAPYPVPPVLDRSSSQHSRMSYYHDAPDRTGTPPIALAESAKIAGGPRPTPSMGRRSTSSIHLSPQSSPPLSPHVVGGQSSVGTPPFFASSRFFPNPASNRPRSIVDELDRSLARQGPASPPAGDSPHFSPPSRPSSPPTHLSPRFRQASFGPPSAGNTAKVPPSSSQLSSRAASPLMWKTPGPQTSTDSASALPPPRPRNSSSGNLMQMRKSFHASGRQSSQDQMATAGAGALAATSAFGVQTGATPRRATASPPPFSYDGNWPPSRYSHLDMAAYGSHDGEAAATSPDAQLSPNLRPASPSVSPRPSRASLQGGGGGAGSMLNVPSVAPSDSEHFWRTPSTGGAAAAPARLDPAVDLERKTTSSVAPSSRSISPVLRAEDNAAMSSSGIVESPAQVPAQGGGPEKKWSNYSAAEETEEEGELREAERNLVWGPGGKRHTLFVANED